MAHAALRSLVWAALLWLAYSTPFLQAADAHYVVPRGKIRYSHQVPNLKASEFSEVQSISPDGGRSKLYVAKYKKHRVFMKLNLSNTMTDRTLTNEAFYQATVWNVNKKAAPEVIGVVKDQHSVIMERIPGVSLKVAVDRGYYATAPTRRELVVKLLKLGTVLKKAGIGHYDLSPENILIRNPLNGDPTSDQGDLSVIDFGLASNTGKQEIREYNGKYASPEQIAWVHSSTDVAPTPASDVASLVKVMYYVFFRVHPARNLSTADMLVLSLSPAMQRIFAGGLFPDPLRRWGIGDMYREAKTLGDDDL